MQKLFFVFFYKIKDLISFRFFCYFPKIKNLGLICINSIDKVFKLNYVFYNKWGIGDISHDICYLQELFNKRIINNPILYVGKSYYAIESLKKKFPDIQIRKFPPRSLLALSLWQNQFRDLDKIKYDNWRIKCRGLKKDFQYKSAIFCSYKRLPKRINIVNDLNQKDLIIGFKYGAKTIPKNDKCILICNSLPLSGQATIEDVKGLEEMADFFSNKKVNVYLTKKLEFINPKNIQRKYISELSYTLSDYLNENREYSCIIGVATGPCGFFKKKHKYIINNAER